MAILAIAPGNILRQRQVAPVAWRIYLCLSNEFFISVGNLDQKLPELPE